MGPARAADSGTTTTTTTATTTTSTTTTTATTTPSYVELSPSSLPAGCVGAGAVAVLPPSHRPVAFGTPAAALGPSAYDTATGSVLDFTSSSVAGSTCKSAEVTLRSLSLFDGTVIASGVRAADGKGTVTGLEINGSPVTAKAGRTVKVGSWGQLTLGAVVGRVRAPLVVRLLQSHDSLTAGTAIAIAFAATAKPVGKATSTPAQRRHLHARRARATRASRSHKSSRAHRSRKHRRHPMRPPPDFPSSPYPFLLGDALAPAAERNPVVSIATRYLGVPYKWAGASPKTGFDCSGLVKYVFAKLGVSLPHYAAAQYYLPDAVPVPPHQLRAGDLVFFTGSDGTRKAPGHVGIYIGDGYLIDAPHTGAFVEIDSLDARWFANNYVGARRIVGLSRDDRRLLSARTKGATPSMFPPQAAGPLFAGGLSSVAIVPTASLSSALHVAAAPTAALSSELQAPGIWTGACILALLMGAGALTLRRRQRTSQDGVDRPD